MHVLLMAVGPLPFYKTNRNSGMAHGSWQLCRAMLDAGHKVDLVTMENGCFDRPEVVYHIEPGRFGELTHHVLPEPRLETMEDIAARAQEILETVRPNCVVSSGSAIASFITTQMETNRPIWYDLFGEMLAERQAKLALQTDDVQPVILELVRRMLLQGDRFSTVSDRQRLMVVGQLSMVGRLNGPNAKLGTTLVQTMPCGIDTNDAYVHDQEVIRGSMVPRDAFVVLWSGGFNTWADIDMLFRGVDEAMERNPLIHFVATGGPIGGHHESGYDQFRKRVERSRFRERYHFEGWVDQSLVHNYFLESDVGINCDLDIYESEVGTRTRMLPWFKAGLPPVTTLATELSEIIYEEKLGWSVPLGRPTELARTLTRCAEDRTEVRRRGQRARRFAYKHFGFTDVTTPLLEWLENPKPAPDRERASSGAPPQEALKDVLREMTPGPRFSGELPEALVKDKRLPWWRRWF